MGSAENGKLDLMRLAEGRLPAIPSSRGASMAEAAAVCFENQHHTKGVLLIIDGNVINTRYEVYWPSVTDQMLRCWNDLQEATEEAAYGVACLLIVDLTEYTIIRRSHKGSGVDFWLGREGDILFQNAARLEVSGILNGNSREVSNRLHIKITQTRRSDNTSLPVYIVIVEFGSPLSLVMRR